MGRVFSIGYGGRSFEGLLSVLNLHKITHLVDIRTIPYSRYNSVFDRGKLEQGAGSCGIRYIFMGDRLGGRPSEPSCYDSQGHVVYPRVAELSSFKVGIEQIIRGLQQEDRVICLLCSEAKPEECHRSKLVGEELSRKGVEIVHISERDDLKSQPQIMDMVAGSQPQLFDEPLTSRKAYRRA